MKVVNVWWLAAVCGAAVVALAAGATRAQSVAIQRGAQPAPSTGGAEVRWQDKRAVLAWPAGDGQTGYLALNLAPGADRPPLIEALDIGMQGMGAVLAPGYRPPAPLLKNVDPVTFVTVGTRRAPQGRPPEMSIWNVFFDKPSSRPHSTHPSRLNLTRARDFRSGSYTGIALGELAIGPFSGELLFTVYPGSRLVHVEAVVSTALDERAISYDAGLLAPQGPAASGLSRIAWMDTAGRMQGEAARAEQPARPQAVRHRALIGEGAAGSVAIFPPPHQYQFPRDLTDNYRFTWVGRGHHGTGAYGFGIRQDPGGGGAFVPWFNAPPGTRQRLGIFYLLNRAPAPETLRETLRYTHNDRFPTLPGHVTFTSHYHMAIAVAAMQRQARGQTPVVPEFVRVFKEMGVNALHLGEFHGDGHPKDPGPLRLLEMEAMFAECRRLSDADFLLMPGEEINDFLGIKEPGKHPGHWMSFFPKPVYWTQQRAQGQPFTEAHPEYGTVYHVGSRADMMELLKREKGLAWAAHPRIKASSWTPDIFRREDFYLADTWLGGAWKAMPADLSRPRLGERGLDLLNDMANWGQRKYMPGEVDVFKIDSTHELYAHMNINYLRMPRLPRYDEGWQPVLDTLRSGKFFVTTGEIVIRDFTLGGRRSGEELALRSGALPRVRVTLDWTFPLRSIELISGDGAKVYHQQIARNTTAPFERQTLDLDPGNLTGRKWFRFEVWDIAGNGAFTQPVWLKASS